MTMKIFFGCVLLVLQVVAEQHSPWTWVCESQKCVKKAAEEGERATSLQVCKLKCLKSLWPWPSSVDIADETRNINPSTLKIETQTSEGCKKLSSQAQRLVDKAWERFLEKVREETRSEETTGDQLVVTLLLRQNHFQEFSVRQNESYHLSVSPTSDGRVNATIEAENFLGARHGLETLSQLIVKDDFSHQLVILSDVQIKDSPRYPYRGLVLDTSRNFISLPSILRTIDAMATNKLNSFHWHITDSHSFPFQSTTFPKLTEYGAYSPKKIYTKSDIEQVVEYARVRGIKVIPEFDAPAHVGEGWQWAPDAVVCFKAEPWSSYCVEPPCGQFNPTSETVYKVLEGIYSDMDAAFKSDIFHMGGDEVHLNCWNSSEAVVKGMEKWGLNRTAEGFHKLWNEFQSRALKILEKSSGRTRPIMLWTSSLTDKEHLKFLDPSKYIIQIWTKADDPVIAELVKQNFPIVISNYDALYFDCGFGAWVGDGNNWCSPYIPWQKVYHNDPLQIVKNLGVDVSKCETRKLVLGGEAALWTEQADDTSVDSRFWPRSSAMAEALWTGQKFKWQDVQQRYLQQRSRMVRDGVAANTVQPEWCYQNAGSCYL